MEPRSFQSENPYAPPANDFVPHVEVAPGSDVTALVIRRFRNEIHALGAVWIFLAFVTFYAGMFLASVNAAPPATIPLLRAALLGIALLWLVLGVLARQKNLNAVYLALALTYALMLWSLALFNVCGAVPLLLVIAQGHRVIAWAKRLRRAGLPLTVHPESLQGPPT